MKFNVKPPTPPNFVVIENITTQIPIENLTEEEAIKFAELMYKNFLDHYKKKLQGKKAAESISGPLFIKEQIDRFTDPDKRVIVTGVKHHSID